MSFLTSVIVLAFVASGLGQDPEITERILPEIRRQGVTGRLVCVVINQMNNPVYWIHRNTQTTISSDEKIIIDRKHNQIINGWPKYIVEKSVKGEKISYTLIINRLENRDHGLYTCQILVRGSNRHPSKDGKLVVLVPPAIVKAQTTHTITVKQGSPVNLTCDASGYPTPNVTWVRVNGNALPNGKLRWQSHYLHLNAVRTEDRGIYRCLADNNVRPPSSHDATIVVSFQPTAVPIQSSYGQAENRMFDITIECRIAGYPEPDLTWFQIGKGGEWKPISNDDKHTINILLNHANILNPQERWFQLVIRTVTANDFGDYICHGKNNMGVGYGKIKVFATSECQGPNCPPEQSPEKNHARKNHSTIFSFLLLVIPLLLQPFNR